jgi:hypothetical protein
VQATGSPGKNERRSFSPKTARARCVCSEEFEAKPASAARRTTKPGSVLPDHRQTQTNAPRPSIADTDMKISTKRLTQAERAASEQSALAAECRNRDGSRKTDEVHGTILQHLAKRNGCGYQGNNGSIKDSLVAFAKWIVRAYTEVAVVTAARWTQRVEPDLKLRASRVARLISLRSAIQRRLDSELQMNGHSGRRVCENALIA